MFLRKLKKPKCSSLDGAKYNFEEIGGFQVSTGSGSYTLDLENMPSGEAQTYLDTF